MKVAGRNAGHTRRVITGTLVVLALVAAVLFAGCGSSGSREVTYSISMGGTVVGRETVSLEEGEGGLAYRSYAERPFLEYDTSYDRRFLVSGEAGRLVRYQESRRENGVNFRTWIRSAGGAYEYLRDGLQTFAYAADLSYPDVVLPFEPECAATVQAVLDGLLGRKSGGVLVVVPSQNMVARQAELVNKEEGRASLRVAGVGELELDYDSASGQIERIADDSAGLVIEKAGVGRLASKAYAPAERVVVKDVSVPATDGVELKGSFYVPKAKPPYRVAVLAGDFGPQDRTGAGVLSKVAEALATDGIAALTCDRRGVSPSGGKYATYTLQTAVEDLNSQLDYLVLRSDIDTEHMYVVGYGEGGVVAAYASGDNPYVSACVFMAAPELRPFPDLAVQNIAEAFRRGDISEGDAAVAAAEVDALMEVLGAVEGDYVEAMGRTLFLGWMRSYAASDMPKAVSALRVPVLVLQGGDDRLVEPEQARRLYDLLEAREGGVQDIVVFDGLGHGFGPVQGEAASRPYRSHALVESEVTRSISGWLKKR